VKKLSKVYISHNGVALMQKDRLILYRYGQNYGYSHRKGREVVTELEGTSFDICVVALSGKVAAIKAETGSAPNFVRRLPQDKKSNPLIKQLEQHELQGILSALAR
jgi:hypothetical protein